MISVGLKQESGRANLREKLKINRLVGAKNRGRGGPNYGKKGKQMDK